MTAAWPWCVAARRPLNEPWRSADRPGSRLLLLLLFSAGCCFPTLWLQAIMRNTDGSGPTPHRDPTRHRREPTSRCAPGALAGKRRAAIARRGVISVRIKRKRKSWGRNGRQQREEEQQGSLECVIWSFSPVLWKNTQPQTHIVSRHVPPKAAFKVSLG